MNKKILSVMLCGVLCISMMSMLAGCGGGKELVRSRFAERKQEFGLVFLVWAE